MFSLFSLNPLNALGAAMSMASTRCWTEVRTAIALATGWGESREICVFTSSSILGCSTSYLLAQRISRQEMLVSHMLGQCAQASHEFGQGVLVFINLGKIASRLNTRTSVEYKDIEYLGNGHLSNPAFKLNPCVDSDSRQLTSGRYRFAPVPA